MREIIVPDIHEQIEKLEGIEQFLLKADKVYFLGDWFDSFSKKQRHTLTAIWLKEHLGVDGWVYLLGNHDCHYAFDNINFSCSGFDWQKKSDIKKILTSVDWMNFGVWDMTEDERFLLSHAGFRPETKHFLTDEGVALEMAYAGECHPLFEAGQARGGYRKFGGPTWLDFKMEFEPLPGQRQIVGHTNGSHIRSAADDHDIRSYCIDTGLMHLAIYEDGHLTFQSVDDIIYPRDGGNTP